MKENYHFVAISGSLRKGSYNTSLLKAVQKLAPENIVIEQLFIDEVPLYNFDLFEHGFPLVVEKLNDAIKAADAVIIVTPEYNYSVPGVLKNTLDFISRSSKKPFDMKPVGIMGASTGMHGTSRAQYHLRQIMVFLNAYAMSRPEFMLAQAATKFDEYGTLTDEKTRDYIETYIRSLAELSDRFNNK